MPYKDPEKEKEKKREWYLKNKDLCMQRAKTHYHKNKNDLNYRQMCRDKGNKYAGSKKGKMTQKEYHLKHYYGLTLEDYNKMFREQNGCCYICGIHQSELKKPLGVDHNHKTGRVRKLLCNKCNTVLGLVNENINILKFSIEYLNEFS